MSQGDNGAPSFAVLRLCERLGVASPKDAVREGVSQMLHLSLTNNEGLKLPIPIFDIATIANMHITTATLDKDTSTQSDEDAVQTLLIPEGSGFHLRILGAFSQQRIRATIAHEVGHTLFYEIQCGVPQRPLGLAARDDEEVLCEFAAREFLLPYDIFDHDVRTADPNESWASWVIKAANRYLVSPYLIAERLLDDFACLAKKVGIIQIALWRSKKTNYQLTPAKCKLSKPTWCIARLDKRQVKVPADRFRRAGQGRNDTLQIAWAEYGQTSTSMVAVLYSK